jgi:hypothetical protein
MTMTSTASDGGRQDAADRARTAAEALEEALEALEALRPLFADEVEDARFSIFGALSLVEQIQAALPAPRDKASRRDMEKGALLALEEICQERGLDPKRVLFGSVSKASELEQQPAEALGQ